MMIMMIMIIIIIIIDINQGNRILQGQFIDHHYNQLMECNCPHEIMINFSIMSFQFPNTIIIYNYIQLYTNYIQLNTITIIYK